jgi:hypothetical protein
MPAPIATSAKSIHFRNVLVLNRANRAPKIHTPTIKLALPNVSFVQLANQVRRVCRAQAGGIEATRIKPVWVVTLASTRQNLDLISVWNARPAITWTIPKLKRVHHVQQLECMPMKQCNQLVKLVQKASYPTRKVLRVKNLITQQLRTVKDLTQKHQNI